MDRHVSRRVGGHPEPMKSSLREHTFSAQDERVRSFAEFVYAHAPRVGGSFSVVDIGCGSGEHSLRVAKFFPEAKIYAFDISPSNIEEAHAHVSKTPEATRIQFICEDYLACSVPPAALIISDSCFHLIPCEDAALYGKLRDGLAPGGSLIFTLPYDCFYNRCIYLLRRCFKAIRSEALEGVVLWFAHLIYGHKHGDAFFSQRLPYLYLLPARIDNGHFRQALGLQGLKVVYRQYETCILGKPAQRYLVVRHCHA